MSFLEILERFFEEVPDHEARGEFYRSGVFTLPLSEDEAERLGKMKLVISVEEVE